MVAAASRRRPDAVSSVASVTDRGRAEWPGGPLPPLPPQALLRSPFHRALFRRRSFVPADPPLYLPPVSEPVREDMPRVELTTSPVRPPVWCRPPGRPANRPSSSPPPSAWPLPYPLLSG